MGAVPADKCRVPTAFWQAVEAIGIRPAALLRQARLPVTLNLGGQKLVTTTQYFALMRGLEDLSGEPAMGIRMVEQADTSVHPPSSLAAFYARDYRDGLERLARFKRLCTPELLTIRETDSDCTITVEWLYASEAEPAVTIDIAFATLVELGRRGTGRSITPRRIEFTRSGPKSARYGAYFGCPIRYGAARNVLVLDRADLDLPFPGHNPELLEMLTPALSVALHELSGQSSFADQVRTVLKRSLASGRPEVADVARQLGMSERTLQRRITEEGTTFRDLLVDARQDIGRLLLSDPGTEIEEVACLLGYQDTSSFYRAFREWEGVTPSRWRELHMLRPASLDGTLRHLN